MFNLDFTLKKYDELCQTIVSCEYVPLSVHDYLIQDNINKCIILRHDVDRAISRALDMAELEHEYGIESTYYFRHTKDAFRPDIMRKIADMGHEVGFHYEVMDKAKGDAEKAIEIFKRELEEMRSVAEITTVCMHGNPLASWSNRDLWEKNELSDFGIIGEPYLSLDYNKILYLTDTGRTWADMNIRVKDVLDTADGANSRFTGKIASTDDVIDLVKAEEVPQMCILAHPNRWCDNKVGWTKELIYQNVKNIGKAGIVWYRNRNNKA